MILVWLLGIYLFIGLSIYTYAVLKTWEYTESWSFNIRDGYVATLFRYPKWTLFWLEWIVKKVRKLTL